MHTFPGTLQVRTTRHPRRVTRLAATVAVMATLAARAATAQALWTPTNLGTLGGASSLAYATNSLGDVVGTSETAGGDSHAFLWTVADGMVDLGTLGGTTSVATGVNDVGQVVGRSLTAAGVYHAFVWTAVGGMVDLTPANAADATGINNAGTVVGTIGDARAYAWTAGGGVVNLGTLFGVGGPFDPTRSTAAGINAAGAIVGTATTPNDLITAPVVWTPGAPISGLFGQSRAEGYGINNGGLVVGAAHPPSPVRVPFSAFRWTTATGPLDLGTLGGPESFAYGVNDAGEVIGVADEGTGLQRAFLWTPAEGMRDLGTLGGAASAAFGIGNGGHIVGGAYTSAGVLNAVRWERCVASPPVITGAVAIPTVVRVDRRRVVSVQVEYDVTASCGTTATATLSVTRGRSADGADGADRDDENAGSTADAAAFARDERHGHGGGDIVIVDAHTVLLPARRGRTYTIAITAVDSAGLQAVETLTLRVRPRHDGRRGTD